jgi:glycosyltransferase involved in cell wall biosynthesis
VHVHGGRVALWLTTRRRRLLARVTLFAADRVVAVSEGVRAVLAASLPPDRVGLIGNGIDVAAYGPPGPANVPPRIMYAGVLTPRKGLVDLFRASTLLTSRGVRHEILVAGGTPDEGTEAEAEVRRSATKAVRFLGPLPHEAMAGLYRTVDVFCLPSWWEAMPLSLLEAMASGLPVVASSVGDVPKVVDPEVTGRLVPPKDPVALADALEPLLLDHTLRSEMGTAARRLAEARFTTRRMAAEIAFLYDEVLRSRAAG